VFGVDASSIMQIRFLMNSGMAEWKWQNGGMADWLNGGMAEWRNGRLSWTMAQAIQVK
jgi:hypothetical protein